MAKRSVRLPSPGLGRIRGFVRKIFDFQWGKKPDRTIRGLAEVM
jgi:hypothetical protein